MTSSTKPKVHNISHCRKRRTESLQQVTCTENRVRFALIFRHGGGQTKRHTDKLIAMLRTHIGIEIKIINNGRR